MSRFSYIFVNVENSRDWALREAAAETISKFSSLIEVSLRDSADGLVCITPMLGGRSPQHIPQLNALKRFLKLTPSHPGHESLMEHLSKVPGQPQGVAASVFMDTAATAALFSKAVALVIDHIFNNSKEKDVYDYLHPKDAKGDGEVVSLIREVLRKELDPINCNSCLTFEPVDLQERGRYWDEQILGVRSTDSPLENYG